MLREGEDGVVLDVPHIITEEVVGSIVYSNLGNMYRCGDGVPRSGEEAVRWLTMAADRGYVPACCFLAKMYERGTACRNLKIWHTNGIRSRHPCQTYGPLCGEEEKKTEREQGYTPTQKNVRSSIGMNLHGFESGHGTSCGKLIF